MTLAIVNDSAAGCEQATGLCVASGGEQQKKTAAFVAQRTISIACNELMLSVIHTHARTTSQSTNGTHFASKRLSKF